MSKKELLTKVVEMKVEQMKKQNIDKFGITNEAKINENPKHWYNLYKTYPVNSKTCFSLTYQYNTLKALGF